MFLDGAVDDETSFVGFDSCVFVDLDFEDPEGVEYGSIWGTLD